MPWWTQGWVGGALVTAVVGVFFTTGVEVVVPLLEPVPAAVAVADEPPAEPSTFARSASSSPPPSGTPSASPSPSAAPTPSAAPSAAPAASPTAAPVATQPVATAAQKRAQARRARLRRERRAARELAVLARKTFESWGPISGTWVLPVASYRRLSSTYGETGPHWESIHTGQDFSAPTGTKVRSVTAGMVTFADWDGPYGNKVEITHPDGNVTWYAHLSRIDVAVTDQVSTGQVIGLVGSTGNSTGPHLHFEVRPDGGDAVDPVAVLKEHGVKL